VMYLGKVAEVATPDALYETPAHPYTNLLVSSIPVAEPGRVPTRLAVVGEPPSPIDPPSGCRFHPRCPRAAARCSTEEPVLRLIAPEHSVACHYPVMPGETVATTSPEKV
jgi:peptide/nickel transport system ATP-binding protein